MAVRVLEETGLLPHLNPGVMTWEEMNRLKPVSPSMGMMLETTSRRLLRDPRARPTSAPPTRTPTSGCGCSRTPGGSRSPSPPACWSASARPWRSGPRRSSRCARSPGPTARCRRSSSRTSGPSPTPRCATSTTSTSTSTAPPIAVTRLVLGPKARVQAPPNLVDLAECRPAARRRRRRLGRRLPADPRPRQPRAALALAGAAARAHRRRCGFELRARLTVHPEYVRGRPASPGSTPGSPATSPRSPGPTAWRVPGVRPVGLPWQEPDGGFAGRAGRTDLHDRRRHRGPHRRPALRLRRRLRRLGLGEATRPRHRPRRRRRRPRTPSGRRGAGRGRGRPRRALRRARADPDDRRGRPARPRSAGWPTTCAARSVGDDVTYVVNRNINFTNVCYVGCRFCAFAQRRTDADAYSLSLDEVADRAAGGVGPRRHRGLHAGRHRPRAAGHGVLRPGRRGEAAGARHARARLLPDGGRQRHRPHRAVASRTS